MEKDAVAVLLSDENKSLSTRVSLLRSPEEHVPIFARCTVERRCVRRVGREKVQARRWSSWGGVSQFSRVQIDREDGSGFVDPALGLKSGGESGAWTNDIGFQARRERRIEKKGQRAEPCSTLSRSHPPQMR